LVNGSVFPASSIAAGGYVVGIDGSVSYYASSCAIHAVTGAVVCWGNNDFGQTTPPASVDGTDGTASAIAMGGTHGCAIQAGSGAVVCWGAVPTPPASVDGRAGTASAITAGLGFSCAIQAGTGAAVCWGGPTPPASVDGTAGTVSAIAAGYNFVCAIQAGTAAVVCWGPDELDLSPPPASVDGTRGSAIAIAAGTTHALAIAAPLRVTIDVKPRRANDPIQLRSRGVIPVAILGSATFDVNEIDVSTLAFGPGGASPKRKKGVAFVDLNRDGFVDLVARYPTRQTGISVGVSEACLTGELLDGTPFDGCETIRMCRPHGKGRRSPAPFCPSRASHPHRR
jgi:hypothetical protein